MAIVFSRTLDLLARRGPISVFVRDDDVDQDEESLHRLIDLCMELQVPLSLAVVPGLLTDAAADYLMSVARQAPGLLELHQHGWLHRNHEAPGEPPAEFGSKRSFDDQLAALKSGRRRMDEAFGEAWYPGFTPPWHASNRDTIDALVACGFEAYSGSAESVRAFDDFDALCKVPVTLDVDYIVESQGKIRSQSAIHLFEQMMEYHFAGLLLHHKKMTPEGFAFLRSWLTPLRKHSGAQFETLRSLARRKEPFVFTGPLDRFRPVSE